MCYVKRKMIKGDNTNLMHELHDLFIKFYQFMQFEKISVINIKNKPVLALSLIFFSEESKF